MKGRYIKIATKFWSDEKMIELDPNSKLLYLYILSCPHSNMAGYYRLPKPYIKADLDLSDKELSKAFGKLLDKGLIKYCERSSVVLVPNYFKYNSIQNKNQAKGAANRTSELPKNSLVEDYKKAVERHATKYKKQLYEGLPKGLNKQFVKGSGNTETDTETELETEIDNSSSLTKDQYINDKEIADNDQTQHKQREDEEDNHQKNDKEIKNLANAYQDAFGNIPSPFQIEMLQSYVGDGMSEKVVILALQQAALANANSLNYVKKILNDWLDRNITTVSEAEMAIEEFKKKCKTKNQGPSPPKEEKQPDKLHDLEYLKEKGWNT